MFTLNSLVSRPWTPSLGENIIPSHLIKEEGIPHFKFINYSYFAIFINVFIIFYAILESCNN